MNETITKPQPNNQEQIGNDLNHIEQCHKPNYSYCGIDLTNAVYMEGCEPTCVVCREFDTFCYCECTRCQLHGIRE